MGGFGRVLGGFEGIWEGLGFRRVWKGGAVWDGLGGFGTVWEGLGGFGRVWEGLGGFGGFGRV